LHAIIRWSIIAANSNEPLRGAFEKDAPPSNQIAAVFA